MHSCLHYKDVTRNEQWGGWNSVMASGDLGILQFGASKSGLETLECERFQSGKIFGMKGSSRTAKSDGGSRMDSESYGSLRETFGR